MEEEGARIRADPFSECCNSRALSVPHRNLAPFAAVITACALPTVVVRQCECVYVVWMCESVADHHQSLSRRYKVND